jgi:hypothetical protein
VSAEPAIRVYLLDGGQIKGYDASDLADDGAYNGRLLDLPAPCFLIRQPRWRPGLGDIAALPQLPDYLA